MGRAPLIKAVIVACTLVLFGCAPQPRTVTPTSNFQRAEPPPGKARIYVLRKVSVPLEDEAPELTIDGGSAFELGHGIYTSVVLPPAQHHLLIAPKPSESPLWAAELTFKVDANRIYFIAIWFDTETTILTRTFALRSHRETLHTPTKIRVEVVTEKDARNALRELHYVPWHADSRG